MSLKRKKESPSALKVARSNLSRPWFSEQRLNQRVNVTKKSKTVSIIYVILGMNGWYQLSGSYWGYQRDKRKVFVRKVSRSIGLALTICQSKCKTHPKIPTHALSFVRVLRTQRMNGRKSVATKNVHILIHCRDWTFTKLSSGR